MGIKDVIENEFSPQNREGTMVGAVTAPHPYWIANILVANTPSVVAIFLDARPSASRLPDPPPCFRASRTCSAPRVCSRARFCSCATSASRWRSEAANLIAIGGDGNRNRRETAQRRSNRKKCTSPLVPNRRDVPCRSVRSRCTSPKSRN